MATRKGDLDEATVRGLFPRLDELPFDAERRWMATPPRRGRPGDSMRRARSRAYSRDAPPPWTAPAPTPRPPTGGRGPRPGRARSARAGPGPSHPGATVQTLDAELGGLTLLGLVGMIDPRARRRRRRSKPAKPPGYA